MRSIRVFHQMRDPEIPITLRPHENIVQYIKALKIGWLGHVERMSDKRMQKENRPTREGWIDDIASDLRSLGIRNWKAKAGNRNEWKAILREAKINFNGLSGSLIWSKTLMELIFNPCDEVQSAQLAKYTLLTSRLVTLGSYQIF